MPPRSRFCAWAASFIGSQRLYCISIICPAPPGPRAASIVSGCATGCRRQTPRPSGGQMVEDIQHGRVVWAMEQAPSCCTPTSPAAASHRGSGRSRTAGFLQDVRHRRERCISRSSPARSTDRFSDCRPITGSGISPEHRSRLGSRHARGLDNLEQGARTHRLNARRWSILPSAISTRLAEHRLTVATTPPTFRPGAC